MAGKPFGIVRVAHQAFLGVCGQAVPAHRQTEIVFPALMDVVVAAGQLDVAGIEQPQLPILAERRARVVPVAVKGLVGAEHHRLVLPVQQVGAGDVPPVLDPAGRVERPILVEHMVGVPHLAQAVGVVEPAHRGWMCSFWRWGSALARAAPRSSWDTEQNPGYSWPRITTGSRRLDRMVRCSGVKMVAIRSRRPPCSAAANGAPRSPCCCRWRY